jgi:manganese/iron transport system substrate-binding protein
MKTKSWKLLTWSGVAILLLATASACGGPTPAVTGPLGQGAAGLKPVPLGAGEKLKVVTTTNIIGDVVRHIGGDRIALTVMMGIGVEVHTYVPKPADMAAVYDAHVLFANGAGLEEGLKQTLAGVGGHAVQIQLTDGLELHSLAPLGTRGLGTNDVPLPAETGQGGPVGHDPLERGSYHSNADPHVWFDVQNVIDWTGTVDRVLSALDPANAGVYRANAEAYVRELKDLDAWIVNQVATIPAANRKLVTDHLAFGYLASRYGLEQVGAVYPVSPSSEPSASDIAALEDVIRQYSVPAIFTESTVSPKLAEQVAQDMGVKVVSLYTGSLGGPGTGAESYIDLMRYDVQAIVEALKSP